MDPDLSKEVLEFVKSEARHRRADLDTELVNDIGMDGDDAVEFMEKFAERFRVDLSGMQWDAHFGPEGVGCLWPLSFLQFLLRFLVYRSLKKTLPNQLVPVKVRDLVRAAESGKWPIRHV